MRHIHLLFLAFILLLAACTDSATPSPTENTIQAAMELEQSYEGAMANGSVVSIQYPADWGIQATMPDLGIAFTFPSDLVSSLSSDTAVNFEAGQIQVFVLFSPKAGLADLLEDSTAVGLLESFLANVDSSTGGVGEIESKTIDGREAATVLLSESSGDSYAVVIDAGDAYVVLTGTFVSGALAEYQATIEAMAASATFTATVEATDEAPEATAETTAETTTEATAEATESD